MIQTILQEALDEYHAKHGREARCIRMGKSLIHRLYSEELHVRMPPYDEPHYFAFNGVPVIPDLGWSDSFALADDYPNSFIEGD